MLIIANIHIHVRDAIFSAPGILNIQIVFSQTTLAILGKHSRAKSCCALTGSQEQVYTALSPLINVRQLDVPPLKSGNWSSLALNENLKPQATLSAPLCVGSGHCFGEVNEQCPWIKTFLFNELCAQRWSLDYRHFLDSGKSSISTINWSLLSTWGH